MFYRVDYMTLVLLAGFVMGLAFSGRARRVVPSRLARGYYWTVAIVMVLRAGAFVGSMLLVHQSLWKTANGVIGDLTGLLFGVLFGLSMRFQDRRAFLVDPSVLNALRIALAFTFAIAALGKAFTMTSMVEFFAQSGYSVTFLEFIVMAEIFAALGLLVPWTVVPAMFGLSVDMLGAVVTHVHNGDPVNDSTGAIGILLRLAALGILWSLRPRAGKSFVTVRVAMLRTLTAAILCLLVAIAGSVAVRRLSPPTAGAMKVNSKDGLTYIWIPAGTFTMGCSPGENECFDDEKPAHEVTISKGFWIGQTLVTQAAYKQVVGANPSRFKGERLPVETVSWEDAQSFCRAVGMRLPTEAQWEYAARAGSKGPRYGDLDAIAWYAGNSGPHPVDGEALFQSDPKNYENILIAKGNQTHVVGLKQANAWQLYDMLGNVWEWTADWFEKTYYARSEARDPTGPSNGAYRVLRGGAWDDNARNTRLSNRYSLAPDSRYFYAGLRCVGE